MGIKIKEDSQATGLRIAVTILHDCRIRPSGIHSVFIEYPPTLWGTLYFCFAKNIRMMVGEYEHKAVYKRYNIVGNGPNIRPTD